MPRSRPRQEARDTVRGPRFFLVRSDPIHDTGPEGSVAFVASVAARHIDAGLTTVTGRGAWCAKVLLHDRGLSAIPLLGRAQAQRAVTRRLVGESAACARAHAALKMRRA